MSEKQKRPRFALLDGMRGLCILSMALYHAMYDLVNLLGLPVPWYNGPVGYVWQQSICWAFILLSGFCWGFSRKPVRHGLLLSGCGCLITVVTWLVIPEEQIFYGVLNLLGLSGLLLNLFHVAWEKTHLHMPAGAGLFLSLALFFITRDVPRGFLGFEGFHLLELPAWLYEQDRLALFGFPSAGFFSSDYFPLIPWTFLYLAGHFLQKLLFSYQPVKEFLQKKPAALIPFCWAGRHSLWIYLLHQPALLGIFLLAQYLGA